MCSYSNKYINPDQDNMIMKLRSLENRQNKFSNKEYFKCIDKLEGLNLKIYESLKQKIST